MRMTKIYMKFRQKPWPVGIGEASKAMFKNTSNLGANLDQRQNISNQHCSSSKFELVITSGVMGMTWHCHHNHLYPWSISPEGRGAPLPQCVGQELSDGCISKVALPGSPDCDHDNDNDDDADNVNDDGSDNGNDDEDNSVVTTPYDGRPMAVGARAFRQEGFARQTWFSWLSWLSSGLSRFSF